MKFTLIMMQILDSKSSMRTIAVEDVVGTPIFNHDDCQHMYTMRVV